MFNEFYLPEPPVDRLLAGRDPLTVAKPRHQVFCLGEAGDVVFDRSINRETAIA